MPYHRLSGLVGLGNLGVLGHHLDRGDWRVGDGDGVRHGCFCAHPLIAQLLGSTGSRSGGSAPGSKSGGRPALPGAVRASLGLGTTAVDVDRLVGALESPPAAGPGRAIATTISTSMPPAG